MHHSDETGLWGGGRGPEQEPPSQRRACLLLSATNGSESQLDVGGFALAFQKVLGEAV